MLGPKQTLHRKIELDFIRGIAILLVLSYHYRRYDKIFVSPIAFKLHSFGWAGVDLFFVLSGFLVGGLLIREWKQTGGIDAIRFLKRRAFKIWPAYYFFLAIASVAHVRPFKSFLYQGIFNVQNYVTTSLSHTWSLAVEEQFYLLIVAVFTIAVRRKWTPGSVVLGCLGTATAIEILRAILVIHSRAFYFYTHTRADALLLGVSLALLLNYFPVWFEQLQKHTWLLILIVFFGLMRLYLDNDARPEPNVMTSPMLITIVDYASGALLLLLYRHRGRHLLAYRLVAKIGIFSYGIYLWHIAVLRPLDWILPRLPPRTVPLGSTLLPYGLAIIVGIAATKAIELPLLRLRERVVPARVPEAAIPSG